MVRGVIIYVGICDYVVGLLSLCGGIVWVLIWLCRMIFFCFEVWFVLILEIVCRISWVGFLMDLGVFWLIYYWIDYDWLV